jgi:hypothetical protein
MPKVQSSTLDLDGAQLQNAVLHNITGSGDWSDTIGGIVGFMSANDDKRIAFWDNQTSALVKVPRLDRAESVTGIYNFTNNFTVGSTTVIASLNADLLDGYNSSTTATQSTIPVYGTGGVLNVATPTASGHAATKGYVDSAVEGLDIKASCRVATTGSIADLSAVTVATIDGVTLVEGDRVLVKNTASPDGIDPLDAKYNGIYVVGVVSVGVAPLTRASDANVSADVTSGMFTFIGEGTVHSNEGWTLTTDDPITLDTTALTFEQFSGAGQITAGNGIDKTGDTISLKVDGATTWTHGGLLYGSATSTVGASAALSGIIQGNGTSAPTGISGTQYGLPYFATTTTVASTAAGTSTQVLHGNSGGAPTWGAVSLTADVSGQLPVANGGTGATTLAGAGIVTASGTINTIPKFTAATTIGDSTITDDGTTVTINTALTVTSSVVGMAKANATGNIAYVRSTGGTNNPGIFFNAVESTGISTIDFSGSTGFIGMLALGTVPQWEIANHNLIGQTASTISTSSGALTLAPATYTQLLAAGASGFPALGTVGNTFNILRTDGAVGLLFSYDTVTGDSAIQSGRTDGVFAYNLILQPGGGNVGIGTTTPSGTLDVRGVTYLGNQTAIGGGGTNQWHVLQGTGLYDGASNYGNYGGFILSANNGFTAAARRWLVTNALGATSFAIISSVDSATNPSLGTNGAITSGDARLVLTYDGYVGIGTTGPVQMLQVHGAKGLPASSGTTQNGLMRFSNTTDTVVLDIGTDDSDSGPWIQVTNSADLSNYFPLLLQPNGGNVGIGTTSPGSKLDILTDSLGVTQTDTSGLLLSTSTAAAAGAQQISPAARWRGYGWKTDATAASQSVDFQAYLLPIEGAAAPTGALVIKSSIAGGAYSEIARFNSGGVITDATAPNVARIKTFLIGNGSLTTCPVTHSFGTRNVGVEVIRVASPYDTIYPDVERQTTDIVDIKFRVAPTTGEYSVIVTA